MIRTIITPTQTTFTLDIPEHYIGKEIEVIAFQKEEGFIKKQFKKSMSDFTGILSENEYQSLKSHTEQSRKEWNRNI
jgi:hypothetical protein